MTLPFNEWIKRQDYGDVEQLRRAYQEGCDYTKQQAEHAYIESDGDAALEHINLHKKEIETLCESRDRAQARITELEAQVREQAELIALQVKEIDRQRIALMRLRDCTSDMWACAVAHSILEGKEIDEAVKYAAKWENDEDRHARSEVDRLKAESRHKACPCLHTTPCDTSCTCVSPVSSRGCSRCCSYGSPEQQRMMAEHLANTSDEVVRLHALLPVLAEAVQTDIALALANHPHRNHVFGHDCLFVEDAGRVVLEVDVKAILARLVEQAKA